jgi:hypothetical protein
MLVGRLTKSKKRDKKYQMVFYKDGEKIRTTHFGSRGMSDFTIHEDPARKERYLLRHEKRENWDNIMTSGALSRWITWNKPTLYDSIKDTEKRFNIKIVSNI